MKWSLACLAFCAAFLAVQAKSIKTKGEKEKDIYCYFESWTTYRPGNGQFDIENIDASLCTHIAFTFLGINVDGTINILDPWESNPAPDGKDGFRRLVALKEKNPNLKVLVSMGGWNEDSKTFSQVVASETKRKTLVKEVLKFIRKYGFDGFDFDWEYPGRRGSTNPEDKDNYVKILQELKAVFKPRGYILSAAVNCGKINVDISYNVSAISELLDHINVMCYDFHGDYDNYVGHHSPLYASSLDASHNLSEWNIDAGIKYWLKSGADPAKMTFGIATYARTFTLLYPDNASLYADIIGGGDAGPYTRAEGVLGYNEICELHGEAPVFWDDEQMVPHKVDGDQWIGYENEKSIEIKVNYALEKNLGGFMIWSLDTDDFRGLCGNQTYPLINTIHSTLKKNGYKPTTHPS